VETKRCTRKIDRFVKLSPKKACRYLANVFKKKNFFANYSRNYKIINIYSYLFQASFRRGAIEKGVRSEISQKNDHIPYHSLHGIMHLGTSLKFASLRGTILRFVSRCLLDQC
jgi:hypothetical protein